MIRTRTSSVSFCAAVIAVVALAIASPRRASAQVQQSSLLGGLVVTIDSPASGLTVAGSITVHANISPLGALVTRVQFRLDGANLGAADTSAPYAVPWATTTVTNGSHALTAVATDALGLQFTSDPVTVTVLNGPPPDTTAPTVSITAPAPGSTASGTIIVTASASDNVGVASVQFVLDGANLGAADTTSPYAVAWDTTTATNGSHTLTAVARDAAGNSGTSAPATVTVSNGSTGTTFAPGDLVVSIVDGPPQWRHADGTLVGTLNATVPGPSEGLRFDDRGDLFVAHWCADGPCATGNTVEHFDTHGVSQGAFGSGYNCNPHDLAFDASNRAYVGLADCSGDIVRLTSGQISDAYIVTPENRGAFFIDLAADGCTLFYTSQGSQVKRFDACQNRQLADFNVAPLPSGAAEGIRALPDGGVLVASGAVIARLDASGVLVQSYSVTGESQIWAGLDLVGDGTFLAANYATSNVYKFDLSSGSVLATFNTGTAANTAIAITVNRDPPAVSGN